MRVSAAYMQVRRNRVKTLTKQGVSPADIAKMLKVSVDTVQRDVVAPDVVVQQGREPGEFGQRCPACGRVITPNGNVWYRHATTPGGPDYCHNSDLPLPVEEGLPNTFTRRRNQVAMLAATVRDSDPEIAKGYLASLSTDEVQAIALFALAGIDIDRSRAELWPTWTRALVAS